MAASLQFRPDGKFKIMLMGDPHESDRFGKEAEQKTKDFLVFENMALDAVEPDLVIYMGDNTSADNRGRLRECIERITKPIRSRNIPLGIILGNHDLEAGVDDWQTHYDLYREYGGSLIPEDGLLSSLGDYYSVIRSHDGTADVFNLWFMYSGNHAPEGYDSKYAFVLDEQIAWYEENARLLAQKNGGKVLPAMVFQHIPVPEEYELLKEVPRWRMAFDAVPGSESRTGKYYVPDRAKNVRGGMGEAPCTPNYNNGQFASWKKTGDVIGAFFGHDHLNDLIGKVQGITLGQCKLAGFRQYGDGLAQAVRVIELDEKYPSDFTSYMMTYREIVGNYCQSIHGETRILPDRISTRLETSVKIAAGAAAAGAAAGGAIQLYKKIKAMQTGKK